MFVGQEFRGSLARFLWLGVFSRLPSRCQVGLKSFVGLTGTGRSPSKMPCSHSVGKRPHLLTSSEGCSSLLMTRQLTSCRAHDLKERSRYTCNVFYRYPWKSYFIISATFC